MITLYSQLKTAGKVKERLLQRYEEEVPAKYQSQISFEKWYEGIGKDEERQILSAYTDVPVKTWDKLYHEDSQPWDLDNNFYHVP